MADKHRLVTFEVGNSEHARFYAVIYKSVSDRGGSGIDPRTGQQASVSLDTARAERRIVRALNAIGTTDVELALVAPGRPMPFDTRMRALNSDGGALSLSQSDFKLMVGYVETMPLPPQLSEVKVDCYDWLDQAAKVGDTED